MLQYVMILVCINLLCDAKTFGDSKKTLIIPLDADFGSFQWRVHNANHSYDLEAAVPGGVHTALMHNANIGDPYYRFRDVEYRWIAYENWTYYRNFSLTDEVFTRNSVVLSVAGLDTIAKVFINGVHVGSSDNMFHTHEWDIKSLAKKGLNNISVSFTAAPTVALDRFNKYPYDVPPDCPPAVQNGICHMNFLRKEQCSFSWDWGPAFAPQGVWKNLSIQAFDAAVITDVLAIPLPNKDFSMWKLNVTVFFTVGALPANSSASGTISVTSPFTMVEDVPIKLTRDRPTYNILLAEVKLSEENLWWPHGFGKQSLYQLNVTFRNSQFDSLSNKSIKFGFRAVELVQEDIPKSPGFVKGSLTGVHEPPGGIQLDPGRRLPGTDHSGVSEKSAPVCGGRQHARPPGLGRRVYEQDVFYEICDELGIVLWQDVMFGCAMYPTNKDFLASVQREVRLQVRRIGHHPSLLIWAGNNENEAALSQNWYGTEGNFTLYRADYIKLYIDTIGREVNAHVTNIPFVSSSPSNGKETETSGWIAGNPYDAHYGDVHYYDYVTDCWDLRSFPKTRFASEYGFQSWPSLESLKKVSVQDDWDFGSNFSHHRQHHENGNLQMLNMIVKHFNTSQRKNFAEAFHDMIYLTQISQGLCIKFETEHYRRLQSLIESGEGHCMGALYWQLNDIWQAPTWASIEYGGNWKMLHYFAKDFFAPILASGKEEDGQLYVYSITDARDLNNVTMKVTIRKWANMSFNRSWRKDYSQNATSSQLVFQYNMKMLLKKGNCEDRNACFLTFEIFEDGKLISPTNPFFLASFKNAVGLKEVEVTVKNVTQKTKNTFSIQLQTSAIAPFTWLEVTELPLTLDDTNLSLGRFSDNGFIFLDPSREVEFFAWQDISLEDFKTSLTITTLSDLYSNEKKRKNNRMKTKTRRGNV
ncbi:putative beta-mannosidase isoform X2 [Apostichopus japonicus]|uniref:beta-mannosidase n=1 Tax=Stichopus japonicus TaxID=307972 RepID=A0A2G8JIU1_STIJA|nr:putative beta-mannosidase isoform X2 [Apostichopus japonicus]